ncbi:MAG: hypothetical protein ABSG84_10795 [Acidobacteriaceae bacterium]|jgi:hypothetical protein
MTNQPPLAADDDLRRRILERAQAVNVHLVTALATVADDLAQGHNLASLGALDGLERQINTLRSLLLLLS